MKFYADFEEHRIPSKIWFNLINNEEPKQPSTKLLIPPYNTQRIHIRVYVIALYWL